MITFEKAVEVATGRGAHVEYIQAYATLAQALALKQVAEAIDRVTRQLLIANEVNIAIAREVHGSGFPDPS